MCLHTSRIHALRLSTNSQSALMAITVDVYAASVCAVTALLAGLVWLLRPAATVPAYQPQDPPVSLKECRKRLRKALSDSCPATGKPYLVIG